MDGRTFLKLRAVDPVLREIPVVVVCADTYSGTPFEAVDAYLRKPVKVDSLLDIIVHHC
jgi:hypothetical protein